MPIRAWLSFLVIAVSLTGCHFQAAGQASDISTQVPKGYAAATNIPKEATWEEKVEQAMKTGIENQAHAADKPSSSSASKSAPVMKPEKVAAVKHAKRGLAHHRGHIAQKSSKKPWYKRILNH